MRGHGAHMWMCGAMILAAVFVVAITGDAAVLLPAVGCLLMMLVMMRMMGGMEHGHGHDGRS